MRLTRLSVLRVVTGQLAPERSLVTKLAERPFALIGVNTNHFEAKKLKNGRDQEQLNGRSFGIQGGSMPGETSPARFSRSADSSTVG
jgi:hypothetical protein